MDSWPYSAYNRLQPSQAAQELQQQYGQNGPSAQQLLLHHQLRQAAEAQQQAQYQNMGLPPSLVQAANKNQLHQQALANLNMRESSNWKTTSTSNSSSSNSNGLVIIPEPQKRHNYNHELLVESVSSPSSTSTTTTSKSMRQATELKTSQPIFPGQPPPLARLNNQPPQPPPRQSSQPPQRSNRTAFPGQQPPSTSTTLNFREPYMNQQQNRPDLVIQRSSPQQQVLVQQQPSPQQQQMYNNPSPQSVASPQGYYQNPSPHDQYYQQQQQVLEQQQKQQQVLEQQKQQQALEQQKQQQALEQQKRQQQALEQQKRSSSSSSSRSRSRSKSKSSTMQPSQNQMMQQQQYQQQQQQLQQQQQQQYQQQQIQQQQMSQQDIGLARLGALGALADLNDGSDLLNEVPSTINYEDLGLGGNFQANRKVEQQQKVSSSWLNRASELLDLSSGDSRDTPLQDNDVFQQSSGSSGQSQQQQQGLIPQIVMNPWDPSQTPVMTFAPLANAVQAYQQQWLLQQQAAGLSAEEEAAITHEMDEEAGYGKPKVVCISPDDEMGFLLNLPPPCNVILQPSTIGLSGKTPSSPYMVAYEKFLKGETPVKPAAPSEEPPPGELPGKKKYIPPYTPKSTKPSSTITTGGSFHHSSLAKLPGAVSLSSTNKPRVSATTSSSASRSSSFNPSSSARPQHSFAPGQPSKPKKIKSSSRLSDEEMLEVEMAVLPKRESSRRKAKDNSSTKRIMQERLLEDDDELPGLDLSDSDDDATWTPGGGGPGVANVAAGVTGGSGSMMETAVSRHKRLDSDDEEEFEQYRSVVPTPKKQKKLMPSQSSTNLVPNGQDFRTGDFVILRDDLDGDKAPIWRFDSKSLLQRYNPTNDATGDTLYKAANLFSGYITTNRNRYLSVAVRIVAMDGNNVSVVKICKTSSPAKAVQDPELRQRSFAETSQFQENFEVYIQALISQCLDANFLDEVFTDQDEYFVSNIEKVDSVTLLRKDKVMTGVSWSMRFQQAISTWPCLNDLGASAAQDTKCGACDKERAITMVQMFGQPYNQNTLKPVPPSEQACMNRQNFSVCSKCSRLAQLFHRLHHQKHKMFGSCSDVVESRKKNSPGLDTTRILNDLLADDSWLEQAFRKMQDLWADADTFMR